MSFNSQLLISELRCPSGWDRLDDLPDCYKVHASFASWFQASETCRLEGAQLAAIHSAEESQAIWSYSQVKLTGKFSGNQVWIGGHRLKAGKQFEWSDGTHWDFDMLADKVSPDSKKYCLALKKDGSAKWIDHFCLKIGQRIPFICKMKQLKSEPFPYKDRITIVVSQVFSRAFPTTF